MATPRRPSLSQSCSSKSSQSSRGTSYQKHKQVTLTPVSEALVRLLTNRKLRRQKQIQLPLPIILIIQKQVRQIFLNQPNLLMLKPPVNVVGDIHGQFGDLLTIFTEGGFPPSTNYLFLGDYVDRGNHECATINRVYGFYDDCKRRYDIKTWKGFTDIFNCLPFGAVIDERIFCVHAGLSPSLRSPDQLNTELSRPCEVKDSGISCDLLWADPEDGIKGFGESDRGVSFTFGADVIGVFLKRNHLDLICRAHQVVEDGYQFFAQRQLVTVFSAPNYCGEFDNAGAFMSVDADLKCLFRVMLPKSKKA